MSREENKIVLLQPSWLGKIDWSNGIPTCPEKYKAAKAKIIDYWGEFVSPVWDDMTEYRKSFSNNYRNSYDYYEAHCKDKEQDTENLFITYSKNKKTSKQYSGIFIKFSMDNRIANSNENANANANGGYINSDSSDGELEYDNFNYHPDDDSVYEVNLKDNYEVENF